MSPPSDKSTRAQMEDLYPLSPMQRGMLFHSLYNAESPVYFEQVSYRLRGQLDRAAFENAWLRVIERHPVLRTSFHYIGLDQPLQMVRPQPKLPLVWEDWTGVAATQQEARLQAFQIADRKKGFKLDKAPLLRLAVFQLDAETHQVVWSYHHLLLDGWSVSLVIKEVLAFYQALRRGSDLRLDRPRPYRDYIAWLRTQNLEAAERFWRKTLEGFSASTPFGVDRSVGSTSAGAGDPGQRVTLLSESSTQAIGAFARRHLLTTNTIVQAAWASLLSRYSGAEDVVFGSTVSGRPANLAGAESMVGLFINTVPVRVRAGRRNNVLSLLQELQAQQQEARDYEYTPLADIQRWSDVPAGTPLFESLLIFENYPLDPAATGPKDLEIAGTGSFEMTNYPLSLLVLPGRQLSLRLDYDSGRFETATIDRMMGHLETLLDGIVADPQRSVSELPLLSQSEQRQMLVEWNATDVGYSRGATLHELFEDQARKIPDQVAFVFEDQHLTYRELDNRSNQLAWQLRELGVGPELLVGICMERSPELLVGLLGILKAGGAYVPLDPGYPQQRLTLIAADARLSVLLTQDSLAERFENVSVPILRIDRDWPEIERQRRTAGLSPVNPDNLAYVTFTSGSTGRPKGVQIHHRAVVNFIETIQRTPGVDKDDALVSVTTISFDISVLELFVPLLTGARLIVAPPDVARDGALLARLAGRAAATIMQGTPATWRLLQEAGWHGGEDFKILIGGQALTREQATQLLSGRTQVWNMYGPTETTVWSTVDAVHQTGGPIAIGRPIANTQIYVVDRASNPVPAGVPGELWIGGDGVSRGYRGRPELTASSFVPSPFAEGCRLYRTGDLVRYLSDARIEFQGRIDHQVKIRGFRVELGEIEAALAAHPLVREVVVVAREDGSDAASEPVKRLVAYLVADREPGPRSSDLRSHLKERLPDYMVPAVFMTLESMPLTPNGKLDRKALPKPDSTRPDLEHEFVLPRSEEERLLSEIWSQVLRVDRIGVHDNFFELGGDSILSIQIVSKANQAGLRLTPKDIFQHQTVAELARIASSAPAINAEQGPVTGPVPLTPIQKWFFEQNFADPHHFNQAILLEVEEPLHAAPLEGAVQTLLGHHDALRHRYRQTGSMWEQAGTLPGESTSVEHVNLSALPEPERRGAMEGTMARLQASLDLSHGPLWKVAQFTLGSNGPARLFIVVHHLVIDGVSWRILLEDLQNAYEQLRRGETARLPAKTSSFADWARRCAEYAASKSAEQELEYWCAELSREVQRVPADHPTGPNTVSSARTVSVSLDAGETQALLREVPHVYHTQINDVLLAALVEGYARWSGQGSLLVQLEGHGREEIISGFDLSRTTGWFTTMFPVVLEWKDTERPGTALQSVKEKLRAIPNRGFGYGMLRQNGSVESAARLRALPQAELRFNYLGQSDAFSEKSRFSWARESTGAMQSPEAHRAYLLDVSGIVIDGRLTLSFEYSENVHRRETVGRLTGQVVQALRSLIQHCRSSSAGGYTPSDFPLAAVDQATLDRALGGDRSIADVYPLSPMQQGLLFHSLLKSTSEVYFEQLRFTIRGNLSVSAFRRAWQHVMDRHDVLRTSFRHDGLDHPLQVVLQNVEVPLEQQDWREVSPVLQQERLASFLKADRHRGFDVSRAPLMRLVVLQLSENAYEFIWSHHHLLLDGWSLPLILKDVLASYEAFADGKEPQLERARPYRDYIAWLGDKELSDAKVYWQEALKGFTAPTSLAVEHENTTRTGQKPTYVETSIELSTSSTDALRSFGRRNRVTLNTLIEAAWGLLLSRYSGEDDVLFGATVSGRSIPLSGIDAMVGVFINTLPMRVRVSAEKAVLSWLQELQTDHLEARRFEYTPLVQLQGWSEVPAGTPLFQSLVVVENYPVDEALRRQSSGLEIRPADRVEMTNYPLTLTAVPGRQLVLDLTYDSERFDGDTIERMLHHLETLLQGMVAHPSLQVSALRLLTEAEHRQSLVEWNDTAASLPDTAMIHRRFEAWAAEVPDAIAVAVERQRVTYRELNAKANQLARWLQAAGVGPDGLVGIFMERSLELVIAILGVLKAGGAYVPLDPSYPSERLQFMLEDSGASLVLTHQQVASRISATSAIVHSLDEEWPAISRQSERNTVTDVSGDNLAYVIYTSGSTGRPKGAMLSHRAIANHMNWICRGYLTPSDAMVHKGSISFDASVSELFAPILSGGRLVLVPLEWDADSLAETIKTHQVTALDLAPSLLSLMLERGALRSCASLRWVFCGAEVVSRELADRFFAGCDAELYNAYGPTETCIESTAGLAERSSRHSTVPIGRPIDNTRIYLVDASLQPMPIGVPGEVHIGGMGVCRGYRNRPELTAERFIPDPFADLPGARVYRTGDLARWLADGTIDFLGRVDHQVKIRGYRIELGEIESALRQHPGLRDAAVLAREDTPGQLRLVGYTVPLAEPPSVTDLRSHLRRLLPDYMVPTVFVPLEELPRTPNGKLDRRALPRPETRPELERALVEPRTETEARVASLWRELLRVDTIGVDHDFFELGGHSLTATRLVSRVRQVFGIELPLDEVFRAPTVATFAERIDNACWALESQLQLERIGSDAEEGEI